MDEQHSLSISVHRMDGLIQTADQTINKNKNMAARMGGQQDNIDVLTGTTRQMQTRIAHIGEETNKNAHDLQDLKDTFSVLHDRV